MNEIVAKFIEEQKQRKSKELDKKKREHLIAIGLVDKQQSIQVKEYYHGMVMADLTLQGYLKDDKGWYKLVNKPKPLEVTEEEYEEICKVCPPKERKNKKSETKLESNSFAENVVTILAWIVLVIGAIGCIAFMIIAGDGWNYNWALFCTGVGLLISSAVSWGVLLVISNISRKLDRLN